MKETRVRLLAILALALTIRPLAAAEWQENPKIAEIFAAHDATGTFVVYDALKDAHIGHDPKRAETRYSPESTFAIPNALLALSSGAVRSVDDTVSAPQTMSLREAVPLSYFPLHREVARRIGVTAMQAGLAALEYGNAEIDDNIDSFWIDGPLKISAVEQCRFLDRLAHRTLPLPIAMQEAVQETLWLERGHNWILYGKTGESAADMPGVGWWVGWVRKAGQVYPFALNIDMPDAESDPPKRMAIGKACLAALGILPGMAR